MKRRLYEAIKNYCEENECWRAYNTAKEWNEILGTTYSPATFAAAANNGLLERRKGYKATSYEYRLAPREEELMERAEIERKAEERKRAEEIEWAKSYVNGGYDKEVASLKEDYERKLKEAKELFDMLMKCKEKSLEEAKALLNM